MSISIQELIDKRQSLNYPQETSLITLLIFHQRKEFKTKAKQVIKNSFYSFFDGESYSKDLVVEGDMVIYVGKNVNLIRKAIINFGE